ncbi:MAG: hypothetical protein IKY26_09270 [Erysipelotrichaceae bacterium]|nr:hypothetical protein [Erysipelotrichaceae bacterium]
MLAKVYNKELKKEIKRRYTGLFFKECLLRALCDGFVQVSDIKKLSVIGHGEYCSDSYKLINEINDNHPEIRVVKVNSGSNRSILEWNELVIKDGKATIYQQWKCR